MKFALIVLFSINYAVGHAQSATAEEKALRQNADFTTFLNSVRKNNPTGCLCKRNEYVVFSFLTRNNKVASLCVSKALTTSIGYLIYRFGTTAKTEFMFPADTLNSFSQFTFAHYSRGGGKQNAAMYVSSFRFTNGDYTYTLHDNWNSEDDRTTKGVDVINNKTGKTVSFDARGKATGSLFAFTNGQVVKETDEL